MQQYDEVCRLWKESDGNVKTLSKKIGYSPATMAIILRSYGLLPRKPDMAKLLELFHKTGSASEVGRIMGYNQQTISYYIRQAGIAALFIPESEREPKPVTEETQTEGQPWDYCPNCGTKLENGPKCKLRCPSCHYFQSCSEFD